MRILLSFFFLLFSLSVMGHSFPQDDNATDVDIVFCCDLSASTNGLIEHIREHIWDYTDLFSKTIPKVNFRIGFVAFSRPSYKKENAYVKVINDLTKDVENISVNMFNTVAEVEQGDQYVGAALKSCNKNLSWSKKPNAIKIIFLAGNGMVDLGEVDYKIETVALKKSNIRVYPIYSATRNAALEMQGWQEIADLSGTVLNTVQLSNRYYEQVNSFMMEKLRKMNKKLNGTYSYYGKGGSKHAADQRQEDLNIYNTNTEGFRFRSAFKISDEYQGRQQDWDLIDLSATTDVPFKKLDLKTVSDTVAGMTEEEFRAFLIFKKYERKKLLADIENLLSDIEADKKKNYPPVNKNMKTIDIITINLLRNELQNEGIEVMK